MLSSQSAPATAKITAAITARSPSVQIFSDILLSGQRAVAISLAYISANSLFPSFNALITIVIGFQQSP